MEKLIFKSYDDLVRDIKKNIHLLSDKNFDLVVGVPRSGMIPSYLISAYLNIDCVDINSFQKNEKVTRGITRQTKGRIEYSHDAKNILLVDDSVFSGNSMKMTLEKLPKSINSKVTTLAIYSSSLNPKYIDFYFEFLKGRKLFEWGIFHNNIINSTCFDMDGVLSIDPMLKQDKDEVKYLDFLKNAKPKFLPTGKIHSIVTNRLEKYRAETEEWLLKNNVEFENLVMVNLKDKAAKLTVDLAIEHKSKYYKKSDTQLFIESSDSQAQRIAVFSGKPVYAVDSNTYYDPSSTIQVVENPLNYFRIKKNYYKHKIKMFLNRK